MATLAGMRARLDAGAVTGEEAVTLLGLAGEVERHGAAVRLLVAARAAEHAAWREEGHRSPASWVAAVSGTTVGEGRATLEAAKRLEALPATTEALRAGHLTDAQAGAISTAGVAGPDSEADLLEAASALSTGGLHRLCRQLATEQAASCAVAGPARPRRALRFWTDPYGMLRLSGAFGADAGAELVSAVRSRAVFVADEAMAAGLEREPQDAYDADALVALATGDVRTATFGGNAGGRTRRPTLVLHVGPGARAGRVDGLTCEIPDVGSVPLSAAESLVGDAMVEIVEVDRYDDGNGGRVTSGPVVPDHVARALAARDPRCVVPGCAVSLSLEAVFWQVPWTGAGPPELWNLARLCAVHHRLVTEQGYRLAGGAGRWEWHAPP